MNVLTLKEHATDLVGSESPYIGSARLSNEVMTVTQVGDTDHSHL